MRFPKISWLVLAMLLAACGGPSAPPGMKLGKPYEVEGTTYYPEYDDSYDKIGMASWYGPGFHGKYTASGERFNQNALTAAHPTLPMPSMVRVTNLQSGKSLIVRINDRGPFKSNRIIDLSKRAAQELGITSTARVRVQFLPQETEEYIASLSGDHSKQMAQFKEMQQERQRQIVEATDNSSHAGDTVVATAPVMTVSSDDLDAPEAAPAQAASAPARHKMKLPLVQQAWADDNTTLPNPPAAGPVAEEEQPAEENAEAAPEEKPVVSGGYAIQAGAFSSEAHARKLAAKISGSVDTIEVSDKTLWRVRVGPFADAQQAKEALAEVQGAGVPDARVIKQ